MAHKSLGRAKSKLYSPIGQPIYRSPRSLPMSSFRRFEASSSSTLLPLSSTATALSGAQLRHYSLPSPPPLPRRWRSLKRSTSKVSPLTSLTLAQSPSISHSNAFFPHRRALASRYSIPPPIWSTSGGFRSERRRSSSSGASAIVSPLELGLGRPLGSPSKFDRKFTWTAEIKGAREEGFDRKYKWVAEAKGETERNLQWMAEFKVPKKDGFDRKYKWTVEKKGEADQNVKWTAAIKGKGEHAPVAHMYMFQAGSKHTRGITAQGLSCLARSVTDRIRL